MTSPSSASSRPQEPRLLRYHEVPQVLWGDTTSGQVCDWFYTTSYKIHFIMFSLRPGACWRKSDKVKPIWDPDVAFYVLQGCLVLHNPETGEVCVGHEGDTLHFREKTWHFGNNPTNREALMLEAAAPIPADLSNAALEKMWESVPPLKEVRNGRYELLGNWPWNAEQARQPQTIKRIRPSDCLLILQGDQPPLCVSLYVATDKLTFGKFTLLPGVVSPVERHAGDEVAVVTEGRAHMFLPDTGGWSEMQARDGFFVPRGMPHQYYNMSDQPATLVFGVAPKYLEQEPG